MTSSARDFQSDSNGYGKILWKRDPETVMQEVGPPNQQDAARDRAEVAGTISAFSLLHIAVVNGPLLEVKR
jgi:hypothetical protein